MTKTNFALAISLMIVTFMLGLVGGYFVSPTYQQNMYIKSEGMGLGKADRYVDLRYVNAMIAHHNGAILLANQISDKTERADIKHLTAEIQVGEPKAIAELYQWKKSWYNDVSQVENPLVANLGTKDEKTDLRFLNALIAHHQSGIEMTKEIRAKSSRKEVLDNADAVEAFLTNGVVMLKGWRKDLYGVE